MSFDTIPPQSGDRIKPGAPSALGTETRRGGNATQAPPGNAVKQVLSRKQWQVPLGTQDNSPPIYRWVSRDNERQSPVRDDRSSSVVLTSISFFQNLPSLTGLFGLNRYDNPPINRWAIVGSPYRDKNSSRRSQLGRPRLSIIRSRLSKHRNNCGIVINAGRIEHPVGQDRSPRGGLLLRVLRFQPGAESAPGSIRLPVCGEDSRRLSKSRRDGIVLCGRALKRRPASTATRNAKRGRLRCAF